MRHPAMTGLKTPPLLNFVDWHSCLASDRLGVKQNSIGVPFSRRRIVAACKVKVQVPCDEDHIFAHS